MKSKHKKERSLNKNTLQRSIINYRTELTLLLTASLLLFIGVAITAPWRPSSNPNVADLESQKVAYNGIHKSFAVVNVRLASIEDTEAKNNLEVVNDDEVQRQLAAISQDLHHHNLQKARHDLKILQASTAKWENQLSIAIDAKAKAAALAAAKKPMPAVISAPYFQVPILIFHYTPSNFEAQLINLKSKGYVAVDLDQLANAFAGRARLPSKPVIITFDDGFENQMQAFAILQKYQMKATYYIIAGGSGSDWCIGANRRYGDPLQPPQGCGDAYLTWDQIRQLDRSGLITIGSHTVNHRNLDTLSSAQQQYEIFEGKTDLESQLGHSVRHFAYPYGGFNSVTIGLVKQAGFITAVSTIPGYVQSPLTQYSLRRVRSAYSLP